MDDNALIAPAAGDPVMEELLRRAKFPGAGGPRMLAPAAPAPNASPAAAAARTAAPVQAPPAAMIAPAAKPAAAAAPAQPDYLKSYQGWEASRPTLDPNAGKPSILRRILGAAAGGLVGYENPRGGAEIGERVIDAPREAAQRDFANREAAWQAQGPQLAEEQRIGEAQTADANAAADRAKAMLAPAAQPAPGAVDNNNPQANAAASLGMIAQDMAGNPRETYGGPLPLAPAATAPTKPAGGPIARPTTPADVAFNDLMTGDNGKPRVNPETKQPFTAAEAERAVGAARPAARGGAAGGGKPAGAAAGGANAKSLNSIEQQTTSRIEALDAQHRDGKISDADYVGASIAQWRTYARETRRLGQVPTASVDLGRLYLTRYGNVQAAEAAMKNDGWEIPQ